MSTIEQVSESKIREEIELNQIRLYNNKYEYKLNDLIGSGAFGCVYKVKDIETNKIYALKEIQYKKINTRSIRDESTILKRLNNIYIIKYHDSFDQNGFHCIVTEYCSGDNLAKCISSCKMNSANFEFKLILKRIEEVINGLYYLHDNNVVHRDIKPE
jgi:serine/threonine protein kinase